MKVAVTYKDGEIFQHFGHCEQFKMYETEGNRIVSSEIVSAVGSGHGALAGFLKEHDVQTLICGGMAEVQGWHWQRQASNCTREQRGMRMHV